MKLKKTILLLLVAIIAANTACMDQPSEEESKGYGWIALVGGILLGTVIIKQLWQQPQQPLDPFAFTDLPEDMQNQIIQLLSINTTAESVDVAARTINSLAQVNKALNAKFNDPQFCRQLIKYLSKKFNVSEFTVCSKLNTHAAKAIAKLQQQLADLCNPSTTIPLSQTEQNLIALQQQGVDFNFTYDSTLYNSNTHKFDKIEMTPLIMACVYTNTETFSLLLTLDVTDINAANRTGMTALMFAAYTRNWPATKELCRSKALKINQQDTMGNTALIYSLLPSPYSPILIAGITQNILLAGADPEIANNAKTTPLMIAQQQQHHAGATRLINEAIMQKQNKS